MQEIDSHQIGAKIKILRKQAGISQEKLGEMIGVSFQQIQKYENGTNKLTLERLQQISEALGVSITLSFGESSSIKTYSAAKPLETLSKEEKDILKYYRQIRSHHLRELAVDLIKAVASKSKK